MSDRSTVGTDASVPKWFKDMSGRVRTLEQRPQGGANGLITPSTQGAAGTWSPVNLTNGWAAFDALAIHAPEYSMDADGFVRLRGLVQHGASWPNGQILTIPIGVQHEEYFAMAAFNGSTAGTAILDTIVGTPGAVNLAATALAWGGSGFISLSGVCFYAGSQ